MLRHGRVALVVVLLVGLLISVQNGGAQPTPDPTLFDLTLRRAEDAMEASNYSEAIPLYEQALSLFERTEKWVPFAQIRLGLAYLVMGQTSQAETVFSQVVVPPVEHNRTTEAWINAVYESWQRDPRLLPVCQVAYTRAYDAIYYDPSVYPEYVNPYHYGPYSQLLGDDVAPLSCDFPKVLERELAGLVFRTDTLPTQQVQSLGLVLLDHLIFDLNADNEYEWIIWLDSPQLKPLVFVPVVPTHYEVSRPQGETQGPDYLLNSAMRPPATDNQYWLTDLPDGSHALVNVDFGSEYYDGYTMDIGPSFVEVGCVMGSSAPGWPGDVTLWRLEAQELRQFFYALRCEYATPESLFPGGEGSVELVAANGNYLNEWNVELRPAVFRWDAERRTFSWNRDL